jgi:hypothetical protein
MEAYIMVVSFELRTKIVSIGNMTNRILNPLDRPPTDVPQFAGGETM